MAEINDKCGPSQDRVFDAVLAELVVVGIDEFSIEGVARRAGLDVEAVLARWRDRRVLLMEAVLARADQLIPILDTGSLSEDLSRLSTSTMQPADTELGRRWFHRLLPGGRDADLSEVGSDFWAVRIKALESMFQRAAERGELRAGIDIGEATRMIVGAIYYDVIFNDTPVRPEYAAQLHEILLYGLLAPQIHDESLIEDFQNREHMRLLLRATTDAMIDPVALVEAVRDDDGRITDFTFREVNPAACVYLQRHRDELIGGSLKATLPDIELSGMFARYVDCMQTGEPVMVEGLEYFSQRYQQMRRYDLRGARAGTDWLSMTWRDVTDRVEGVQRALAAQTLLAATVDSMLSPQSLLEAVRDPAGEVVDFVHRSANPAFCSHRGWAERDIVGTSVMEAQPSLVSPGLFERYVKCVETGESVILDNFEFFNALCGEDRKLDIRAVRAGVDLISLTFSDVTDRYRAGQRLARSEEQYRLLAENSTDVVVHVRDGVVVWVSPSVNEVLGAPDSYWVGRQIQEVSPPEEAPAFARRMARLASGGTVTERIRVVSLDGVTHWISMRAKPFHDVAGHQDGFLATLRVIDDEVAAEQAAEQARRQQARADALYRRSMESSAVGMCLVDPEGGFITVNYALCEFFGYDSPTLLTKTWQELTAQDYLQADLDKVADVLAGRIESYRMTKQYIHADGHLIWGDLSVGCLRDSDGQVEVLICQVNDITNQVKAQQEIARYLQLMESSSIGINIVRPDGPVVWINQAMCDLFGLDMATAMQKTWQETTPPENLENNLRVVDDLMAGRVDVVRVTQHYFRADGRKLWLDVSVSSLPGSDGKPEYISTQMLDITNEVEARDQLAYSEQRNRLAAQQLQSDLDSAAQYLRAVLPGDLAGRVSVSSFYQPASTVGGDAFDYRWIDDDHLMIKILDVSGHGIEPALLSVSIHNLLRSGTLPPEVLRSPELVLTELNSFFPMQRHNGHYFTIWYGTYRLSTRTLTYAGAGHPPALLFTGDQVTALPNQSPPVGMFSDTRFPATTVQIPPDGQILIYSDGAYEIPLDDGGRGSHEDLVNLCTRLAKSPAWSLEEVVEKLRDRSATKTFTDDCCLVKVAF